MEKTFGQNAATQNSHRGRTPHSVPQVANFKRNRSHIYGAMGQFKPKTCTPLTQRGAGFGLNSNNTLFARKRLQKQQMSEQPLQKTELSEDTTRATNQRKGHQCCAEVSFFLVRPPPLEPSIPPPLILYWFSTSEPLRLRSKQSLPTLSGNYFGNFIFLFVDVDGQNFQCSCISKRRRRAN